MTIAEVTKKYAEMIKMKKQNQFMKLEDIAKKLPGYESSTPGFPLEPPLVPAELQFYFHSPRTERHTPIPFLHEKYIMLFCIRGNRQIELDGKACRLHPNDFLLIPPACNHTNNMPPANPDMNQDYDYAILYASFLLPDCGKKLKSLCDTARSDCSGKARSSFWNVTPATISQEWNPPSLSDCS